MSDTIPIVGDPDGWPRTADGHLVRPGAMVFVHNSCNTIRKIYDGGEYGHCVEVENADGPQGWAPLSDCYKKRAICTTD